MTTYTIKWLKDKLGTRFFPITHIKAVRNDNNTNLESILNDKQDGLVSGVNIKTINGESVLGSGNISVSGGGGGGDVNVIESISVNGTAQAVDANKNVDITVPTDLADLTADSTHRTVTDTEKSTWNNKGTYSKPSGGIPKTDLDSAVQTSLGKADTALQSYTETDPVFSASAAAGITSSDITNWNGKTSNVGTITGINMNGASKGTSGVVDLGTVITAHQDISGKADKSTTTTAGTYKSVTVNSDGIVTGGTNPTTLSGYGITNAYTKTETQNKFFALTGQTGIGATYSSTEDLDTYTTPGSYYCYNTEHAYVSNAPTTTIKGFRLWVYPVYNDMQQTIGIRYVQDYIEADSQKVYRRIQMLNSSGVLYWSSWVLVQDDLNKYLPVSGGTMTGIINFVSTDAKIGITTSGNDNIDVGWDWDNRAGAGLALRKVGAESKPGSFILWARNASNSYTLEGNPANGALTWGGNSVWHAGNDGTGSTLDADLLDGYHASGAGTGNIIKQGYINVGSTTAEAWYKIATFSGNSDNFRKYLLYISQYYLSGSTSNQQSCIAYVTIRASSSYFYHTIKGIAGDLPTGYLRLYYNTYSSNVELYFKVPSGTTSNRSVITRVLAEDRRSSRTLDDVVLVNNVLTNPTDGWSYTDMTYVTYPGAASGSSDARLKNKVDDINLKAEDIAAAPNLTFKWKDGDDDLHGGTYAQYWENITPYYVHGDDSKSLEYGNLALTCSIELAKEIVTLKEENTQLRKELGEIKEMVHSLNK